RKGDRFTFSNVSADKILEVLVWAVTDGKMGWWHASLDSNGEVVLMPTDNMLLLDTSNVSTNQSSFNLPSWVLPAVGIGLLAFSLINPATSPFALAAFPFFGWLFNRKPIPAEVKQFIDFREDFNKDLFQGPYLTDEEKVKLKKILGQKEFNLWQKYYNQKLKKMAVKDPESIKELADYSNETTLTSQKKRFNGTDPMYVYAMKDLQETFEEDLLKGNSFKDAVKFLGDLMYIHHLSENRIKTFLDYKKLNLPVIWSFVKKPEIYRHDYNSVLAGGTPFIYKIGFGVLSREKGLSFTPFDTHVYSEYYDKLLASTQRARNYKGVALSFYNKERDALLKDDIKYINHPAAIRKNGINNIDKMFEWIQEDYNKIEPIIKKAQKGETLTAEDINILHENIAEISYLFTNVKPFYRGSASANLVIVYGLYHMAGINAPKVKIGRALDLEAFATTPKRYKANWLKLFDGNFN
ncbi:MAG: hypothetical protein J6S61_02255, partial [Elusimicrobiaceae bacterium]|nr:hypothetical protein [Elusimicrobiaceae bacterium]